MTTVKERPINLRAWEVLAILDGRKTELRRPIKKLLKHGEITDFRALFWLVYEWTFRDKEMRCHEVMHERLLELCPYGMVGDRLWGRETFIPIPLDISPPALFEIIYGAGGVQEFQPPPEYNPMLYSYERWSPSIHMPRWASRILLEVTGVRVQRLQDISEEDAIAEGIYLLPGGGYKFAQGEQEHDTAVDAYRDLWESINGPGSWEFNDWVWAVTFKKVDQ